MKVLGLDPAFRYFGWSVAELFGDTVRFIDFGVVETKPETKKSNVLTATDNLRRIGEIVRAITETFERHSDIQFVCVESPGGSKSARSANQLGMALGIVGAFASIHRLALCNVTPATIKKRLCGTKSASKAAVADRLREVCEFSVGADRALSEVRPKSAQEHAYDAGSAIWTLRDCHVALALMRSAK